MYSQRWGRLAACAVAMSVVVLGGCDNQASSETGTRESVPASSVMPAQTAPTGDSDAADAGRTALSPVADLPR